MNGAPPLPSSPRSSAPRDDVQESHHGRAGPKRHASTRARSVALLAATLAACRDEKAIDADALRLTRAYEAYDTAAPADRAAALEAFGHAPCGPAADCADRDACFAYASALADAAKLADRARALGPVDAGGNGAATPAERAVIVSAADDAVKRAEAGKAACDAAIARLYARGRGDSK